MYVKYKKYLDENKAWIIKVRVYLKPNPATDW